MSAAPAAPAPDAPGPDASDGGDEAATDDRPLVLGGAVAERASGPHPLVGPPPGGPAGGGEDGAEPAGGRHFLAAAGDRRRRWPLVAAAVPVVAVVVLVGAWAVDTAALSGQVMRNVEVGGHDVGGLGEASLPDVMDEINADVADRDVVITSGERHYETTAGKLGLTVDAEATADAALDAGRDQWLLARPFSWLASFLDHRDVPVRYAVTGSQVVATMAQLQGSEVRAPHDPTIQLVDGAWQAVPGVPGQGIDSDDIAARLPDLAARGGYDSTVEVEADNVPIVPRFTDEEAQALAERANDITADGLTLTAGDAAEHVDAATVRSWLAPTAARGKLDLAIVPEKVDAALKDIFSGLAAEPRDATFELRNGVPVVLPSQRGVACCGPASPGLVWKALTEGTGTVALEVQVTEPKLTTEAARDLGISKPVGGNHAWRDGAPTTAGPGFTTYYDAGQPRVINIHRIADMVRGTVILPGETFSMNEVVGPRTPEKGFVEAGAIREGEHVDEVGGGVSQFATTTFNAAYFAGLDIHTYQPHSEWFSRYPPGREATMGYPAPDLKITNDTPHGVLIWTSYTDTSVTVTLYSTPYASGEQTGIVESASGACRVVTTTRTRRFVDGRTDTDTFRATYRPGPGRPC
ncbi:MAG TPA: VanW family protein [Acidimicrobiales bacterium]|nr:VanW family protein [Acidimicrobiales bacterium]